MRKECWEKLKNKFFERIRFEDVKVMMTQEYFFTLMACLEKAEGIAQRTSYNPEKLMADFESKVEKLNTLIGKVTAKGKKVG